ncbi:MAG: DUF5004 domain-containing protein [Ferruginibacter sp.]
MKKITTILAISALLVFAGCKPESIKDYQANSAYSLDALQGQWKLMKVTQTDEDSKRKLFPYKTLDLTTSMNLTDIAINLNLASAVPATFTAAYGNAPKIFKLTTGNWKLDDNSKPGKLWLINGTDTAKFTIGSYNQLASKKLVLKQVKYLGTAAMITYEYEFSKN